MTVRGYQLAVDWSRQDLWDELLEDVTSRVLPADDLVCSYGRDQSEATSGNTAGKLTFALENTDRALSPENTASPIAGNVSPGAGVRLQVTHNDSIRTLFRGVLDDLEADPNDAARTFTGTAMDAWGRPNAEKLSTRVYSGIRTGEAIEVILDSIDWPGGYDLEHGVTVMPWWWEEGADAATAIARLVAAEGPPAIAYVEGGRFIFRGRNHRLTRSASQTSQALFTHIEPEGSGPGGDFKILKDSFTYNHGLKQIVNAVAVEIPERAPAPITAIWSTDSPISLAFGETVRIDIQAGEPFIQAVAPVADVDYTMQLGAISTDLSRDSGQSTVLTITASGGPAVVAQIAVRAVPLPVARTVKVTEEDPSSIAKHGRQTWPAELPWVNLYDAQAIAQRIVAVYAAHRPTITFRIANLNDTYMQQILDRRISDRITVQNDPLGINEDFIIERITHIIRQLGVLHMIEFGCQVADPVQPANVFTFNVAGKGFDDGAFGINGIDNPATMFTFDAPGRGFNQGVFAS